MHGECSHGEVCATPLCSAVIVLLQVVVRDKRRKLEVISKNNGSYCQKTCCNVHTM